MVFSVCSLQEGTKSGGYSSRQDRLALLGRKECPEEGKKCSIAKKNLPSQFKQAHPMVAKVGLNQ